MKICYILILLMLVACGKSSSTKKVVPHNDDGIQYEDLRWSKGAIDSFLTIKVPCIKYAVGINSTSYNCGGVPEADQADFVQIPEDENADAIVDSLINSVDAWNLALGRTVFKLEFTGQNIVYSDDPLKYLGEGTNEENFRRVAWLSDWFSAMANSNPNKPESNVLAITIYSFNQSSQRLVDADILFNAQNFKFITEPKKMEYTQLCGSSHSDQVACDADARCGWKTTTSCKRKPGGTNSCTFPTQLTCNANSNCYWQSQCAANPLYNDNNHMDFSSVLTHELGHFLGLAHSTEASSIMFASLQAEVVKRSLSTTDKCTINQKYRDLFTTCDEQTAEDKFCYDLGNALAIGVVGGECLITDCKPGFVLNAAKTACIPD